MQQVEEGTEVFIWENDSQMTVQRLNLPNFKQLASLDTSEVAIDFFNPATNTFQAISLILFVFLIVLSVSGLFCLKQRQQKAR